MVSPKNGFFRPVATLWCLLMVLPFALVTTDVTAADYDKPVFEFQSKLAKHGNAKAQYYLAQMYEEGRGTQADSAMARHWYEEAKRNGYTPTEAVTSTN